ncbi:MAG TPA: LLM class flavin-dependent oxidoreductase [Candidatus Bathyarchaeia archaeon]|nr:LLM class flavin-dependent oxidoreductase [Candidatus Bathyarchaeia archaeon]
MKFGIRLPNSGPFSNPSNLVRIAVRAEELGYDSVWVHDHIVWSTELHRGHVSAGSASAIRLEQEPNFYESLMTLAYVASITKRVQLGIAVLVLPLRNPLVVAKQTSTLDVLSGGRLILGVSPGSPKVAGNEFKALQLPFEDRGERTDEYIEVLKLIWTHDLAHFSGKFVKFEDVQIFPKPTSRPHPPIWIGGPEKVLPKKARAIVRTALHGDGWIPAYMTPEEMALGAEQIRSLAKAHGRNSEAITMANELFANIDKNTETARKNASQTLLKSFSSMTEAVQRSLTGTPEDLVQRIKDYEEVATEHIELKFIYSSLDDLFRMMELFATDVLEKFH